MDTGPSSSSPDAVEVPEEEAAVELGPSDEAFWEVVSEPTSAEALAEAELATAVEEQQRAYVEGGVLHSTTTATQDERPELVLPPGLEGGAASGSRVAAPRFPQITGKSNFLHSNNPQNLKQAHDLRNVGVGRHNPLVSEMETRDRLVQSLKENVFTPNRVRKAMDGFESIRQTALPKKLSHDDRMRVELEAMNASLKSDGVGFDTVIKAFVKSEVTAKDKPRAIANHGNTRLFALSKVAWVFEKVLFVTFNLGSIKHDVKKAKIGKLYEKMNGMRIGARWVENDLTAFEFGVSEPLKQIEQEIFRHIAELIGVEDVGIELFERVVDDRDKCATWLMTFRDETGERKTVRIKIPQTMRESGDRVTSSGNWLMNLIAWFSFLVDPGYVDDALLCLIKFQGARMFYVSPRDQSIVKGKTGPGRKKYLACLAFEGDDTVGRLDERVWARTGEPCPVEAFFTRWGWRSKLVWKKVSGDDYVRFVGYEALISGNKLVYEGGTLVMVPEVRRALNTKSWTPTNVTPRELKTCIRIYAATLAEGFTHVEPMHAFLQAVYDDNRGGVSVSAEKVREYILAQRGELPEAGETALASVPMPGFEGTGCDVWKRLLRVCAGEFSDREWADMSHIGTVRVHGADLRTCVPASWRD